MHGLQTHRREAEQGRGKWPGAFVPNRGGSLGSWLRVISLPGGGYDMEAGKVHMHLRDMEEGRLPLLHPRWASQRKMGVWGHRLPENRV